MKLHFLAIILILCISGVAQSATWELCNLETSDGATKIYLRSGIHEVSAREYQIEYTFSGQSQTENREKVVIEKNNNFIRYTNTTDQFEFEIDLANCNGNSCPAVLQTSTETFQNLRARCEFNIHYTPATGSGGRCGGRRC